MKEFRDEEGYWILRIDGQILIKNEDVTKLMSVLNNVSETYSLFPQTIKKLTSDIISISRITEDDYKTQKVNSLLSKEE